jgi:hypothetical protein
VKINKWSIFLFLCTLGANVYAEVDYHFYLQVKNQNNKIQESKMIDVLGDKISYNGNHLSETEVIVKLPYLKKLNRIEQNDSKKCENGNYQFVIIDKKSKTEKKEMGCSNSDRFFELVKMFEAFKIDMALR